MYCLECKLWQFLQEKNKEETELKIPDSWIGYRSSELIIWKRNVLATILHATNC